MKKRKVATIQAPVAHIIRNPHHKSQDRYALIYEIVRAIPRGRVTTYGLVADCLGVRSGARLVGWAMNLSHRAAPDIPAHRVVNRHGLLTGKKFFGGERMRLLLEAEGVRVVEDRVADFDRLLWNPAELTS